MKDYEVFSGEEPVAIWKNRKLTVVNEALLPLYLRLRGDADAWLATRAVDAHRANSRLLKKALRMTERDDVSTVLRANGVTVTDDYWVREIGSRLRYDEVRFDENYFKRTVSKSAAKLALSGSPDSFRVVAENSKADIAELTNIGSFEKCWKNIDGAWWLFKTSTANERFSEIFISRLCDAIGIHCAVYRGHGSYIKTLDFTGGNYNFEPAFSFMGEQENYGQTMEALSHLCPQAVGDYVKMIFLDALVFNPDRHTGNFGLLREKKTGMLTGLAPCFDHNMALIARGYPTKFKTDLLITLFVQAMEQYPQWIKSIPVVTEEAITTALTQTNMRVKASVITDFLLFRYTEIMKHLTK